MKIENVRVKYGRDRTATLYVNDEIVAEANYEDHGSAGVDLLEEIGRTLARMSNADYMEND